MKNIEDTKCVWGYRTVCDKCYKERFGSPPEITEQFPLATFCEWCGQKDEETEDE